MADRSAIGPLLGALELGGTKALCALGTSERIVAEVRIPTRDPEATLVDIAAFFAPARDRLAAVGAASFGPLELDPAVSTYGSLLRTPKPGWSEFALASRLRAALGVPIAIDTDVNAAALAEQRQGAARGLDSCVYVTVGTGVGVGVVIDGRPLHGLLHPELGHLPAPALCDFAGACPFHGRCIEGVAAAPALRARSGRDPALLADDDPVWPLTARYLAHLLATCTLAYAPRKIVVAGGVLERASLLARTRAHVSEQLHSYLPRRELSAEGIARYVVPSSFGQRAGLVGAFVLAVEVSEAGAHGIG